MPYDQFVKLEGGASAGRGTAVGDNFKSAMNPWKETGNLTHKSAISINPSNPRCAWTEMMISSPIFTNTNYPYAEI